uniref:Membrane spanning 4-domains A5 n=1 Tax=Cavia porcellus TaxID=10141 RepID=A0A286XLX8_CAVPO
MDSIATQSPLFLILPPEITDIACQSTELRDRSYEYHNSMQKFFTTKLKTLGFIASGAFHIALKRKTTQKMMKASCIMNVLSILIAIIGIILLTFGFLLDANYLCGYAQDLVPCRAVTIIFVGIMVMLLVFTMAELFISLSFSMVACDLGSNQAW